VRAYRAALGLCGVEPAVADATDLTLAGLAAARRHLAAEGAAG
jgi:hypothetical protein